MTTRKQMIHGNNSSYRQDNSTQVSKKMISHTPISHTCHKQGQDHSEREHEEDLKLRVIPTGD